MANAIAGATLAILGLLMVMDRLSLRSLLAETGPESAWHLALAVHGTIEHTGAQTAELAISLIGLAIVALAIRSFWRLIG